MLKNSRKIRILANKFCSIKKFWQVKINSFSHKETLKDDKLITDVLDNIKLENKERTENKNNQRVNSSSEKDHNLGADLKEVGGNRSDKQTTKIKNDNRDENSNSAK